MAGWIRIAGGAALAGAAIAILVAERSRPLRSRSQPEPRRTARNLVLGALSVTVVNLLEAPVATALARRAERSRSGLVQRLGLPAWARDPVAVAAMDYAIYLWHVATHRVPFLWRMHVVHHADIDMDASTALRFHAAEMLVSIPWRAAQVALIGPSERAFGLWQRLFFASVLFHHSNIRLPEGLERKLALLIATPRMHTIHHGTRRDETDSNWSSGLSIWDLVHRTFRLDVPAGRVTIGLPAYRREEDIRLEPSLRLPFVEQRDAWAQESVSR